MARKQLELNLLSPVEEVEKEIIESQKEVDYDVKEFTVELLVQKFDAEEIFVPEYQRNFIWPSDKRSRFIESVVLGLPIPYLFCSDTDEGRLEIIDGVQRLSTLSAFLEDAFVLTDLEKLSSLNGYSYSRMPVSQQRKFKNRSLRMIVLRDRGDPSVRFDLFERINSGSTELSPAEFRKGAYPGPFYNLILELAKDPKFRRLCPVSEHVAKRGEREELVLRFFAYSDRYKDFSHDVTKFLNDYIRDMNEGNDLEEKRQLFSDVMEFVSKNFPNGFRKSPSARSTPRVRFEAIAVGTGLALKERPNLRPQNLDWLQSEEFLKHTTTHASNSAPRLQGRIEFVRNALLDQ